MGWEEQVQKILYDATGACVDRAVLDVALTVLATLAGYFVGKGVARLAHAGLKGGLAGWRSWRASRHASPGQILYDRLRKGPWEWGQAVLTAPGVAVKWNTVGGVAWMVYGMTGTGLVDVTPTLPDRDLTRIRRLATKVKARLDGDSQWREQAALAERLLQPALPTWVGVASTAWKEVKATGVDREEALRKLVEVGTLTREEAGRLVEDAKRLETPAHTAHSRPPTCTPKEQPGLLCRDELRPNTGLPQGGA